MSESDYENKFQQPIGRPVVDWTPAIRPESQTLTGRYCHLERLAPAHADDLFHAHCEQGHDKFWTYLPYGPFQNESEYTTWVGSMCGLDDPYFYAIIAADSGRAVGVASYLRIAPTIGSIEVGHIHFSPLLQKKPAATEAMYLMMKYAFDELGYRRYEWKCDALNQPSRRSAGRLGFTYEGTFRQHTMYKGRNRDTAWFAIVDTEWPAMKQRFETWLRPDNFDERGLQVVGLWEGSDSESKRESEEGPQRSE